MFARLTRLAFVAVASLGLAACGINTVPTVEEEAKARWADVQSAYQRRADLIPNLVASVRGAAQSETTILTNVTEARSRATSINITTEDLSNPEEFQRFQDAQNELTQALGQLRTVVENYPQLQSQARFADLMTQLEGTENRIDVARTRYNEAVQSYNTTIRTFPATIAANIIYGAEPMQPFQAEAGSQTAPDVDFGDMGAAPARPAPAPAAPANDDAPAAPAAEAN
jgi:LemA protein